MFIANSCIVLCTKMGSNLMRQAEAGSRVELYEAQISKMQLALERADQENSRLEQELRAITESSAKGREERQLTGLAGLRDRMRSISLLTGGSALEQQASERLQVLPIHSFPASTSFSLHAWLARH